MNRKFIEAVTDEENWKPNLTIISEQTGLASSTVKDRIQKMLSSGTLVVKVDNVSELEAMKLRGL